MLQKYSRRSRDLINQMGLNILYKGGSVFIAFFLVSLSIKYLGTDQYGIWLTLFSFSAFFNFFDFGLGHGLRNHLTKAIAVKDFKLAREYVSTAYISIFFIALLLAAVFLLLFNFIDWQLIFKIPNEDLASFLIIIKVVFLGFFINLALKLIDIVSLSSLKPSISGLLNFLYNAVTYIIIYLLLDSNNKSLVIYGSVIISVQILIFIIASIFLFQVKFKQLKPSFFLFKPKLAKNIFGLGSKFLLLQIAGLILYTSDNMIITQLFTASDVTIYNIAYKYFGAFTMVSTLFLGPLWSAITDAEELEDFQWIKNVINKSIKLVLGLSILVVICFFASEIVYKLWVGSDIVVPRLLSFFMAIYVITSMFLQIFSMYLNGVGKIKIQLKVGLFVAFINIPLSILFAKYFGLGIAGIILATTVCNIISLLFLPLQYNRILNKKAYGIWNE